MSVSASKSLLIVSLLVSLSLSLGAQSSLQLGTRVDGLPDVPTPRLLTPGVSTMDIGMLPSTPVVGAPYFLGAEILPPGPLQLWGLPGEAPVICLGAGTVPVIDTLTHSGVLNPLFPAQLPSTGIELSLIAPHAPSGRLVAFQGAALDPAAPNGLVISPESVDQVLGPPTVTRLADPNIGPNAFFGIDSLVADLDGDGQMEHIVGAHGANSSTVANSGLVYLFHGQSLTPYQILESPNPETDALFGVNAAAGDINGDGFVDLVIGEREKTVNFIDRAGLAHVFWGPSFTSSVTLGLPTPNTRDEFGGWIDVGDLNADGYDDVVVSAIAHEVNGSTKEGAVAVFYGPSLTLPLIIENPITGTGGRFGYRVVVDDFDQDGFEDVGVAHTFQGLLPGGTDKSGAVSLYYGPFLSQSVYVPHHSPSAIESALMGSDMWSEDMDQDGYPDLIVGVELDSSNGTIGQGSVSLLRGPNFSVVDIVRAPGTANPAADDGFGSGVAAGDYDGDGIPDLFVGEFYRDIETTPSTSITNAGRAHVLLGPSYVQAVTVIEQHDMTLTYGANHEFGRRVRAGDLDGDGRDEMIVGAPFTQAVVPGTLAGAVYFVIPPAPASE